MKAGQLALSMPGAVQSVVTSRDNGPLIATAAQLWIDDTDLVVDVTYGRQLMALEPESAWRPLDDESRTEPPAEAAACPECGEHAVWIELRAEDRVQALKIDRGAAYIRIDFDNAEWTVEDVTCEECGWNGNRDVHDYEYVGPPL